MEFASGGGPHVLRLLMPMRKTYWYPVRVTTLRTFGFLPLALQYSIVPHRTDASLYRISLHTFELETIFELVNSTPRTIRALCPTLKLIAFSWGLQIHITNWETNASSVVSTDDAELDQLVSVDVTLCLVFLTLTCFVVDLVEWHRVLVVLPTLHLVFAG